MIRDSIIKRYLTGERDFTALDLDRDFSDFSGISLAGADFSRSFIIASFRGCNLAGVNFSNANVKTCDFSYANLEGACFEDSAIDGAIFTGANLDSASFIGASEQGFVYSLGEKPPIMEA